MSRILLVEDKDSMRRMIRRTLETAKYHVDEAADGDEGVRKLGLTRYDLVLTDLKLPKHDGLAVLKAAKEASPQMPVIIMTAFGTIDLAVRAMKEGAYHFITKPFDSDHLLLEVERAMSQFRLVTENLILKERLAEKLGAPTIIGKSKKILEVSALIQKVAASNATVLILGESGTGKELFARALHYQSPRRAYPLVAMNCAAIPDTLIESELFGYERGAFTGAVGSKPGRFELANGGTLFLDEVSELSPAVQAKLLRVLEQQTFERVGGTRTIEVDVRIVAASNADLAKAVRERQFREDLFFRLNVFPVPIPPLRERPDDIPALVEHFIEKFAVGLRRHVREISKGALQLLMHYRWPGNVRELENFVERAVILTTGEVLQPADFSLGLGTTAMTDEGGAGESLQEIGAEAGRLAEIEGIRRALAAAGGNREKAADQLKVSGKTLQAKIEEYGIEIPSQEGAVDRRNRRTR
ncbi:MAG: sigma-54-dependent Fis family transcriptional regulator [candidate division NC10 bacterium]|nr:sigma-54-dependent Fis family transcriptional regulator [candidate division NC10 bacterium]